MLGSITLNTKSIRERLLASSMICGVAVAALGAGQAAAQTTPASAAPAADQTQVEEVVVTGSLFRRTDTETPSPVTVMTAETLAQYLRITKPDPVH